MREDHSNCICASMVRTFKYSTPSNTLHRKALRMWGAGSLLKMLVLTRAKTLPWEITIYQSDKAVAKKEEKQLNTTSELQIKDWINWLVVKVWLCWFVLRYQPLPLSQDNKTIQLAMSSFVLPSKVSSKRLILVNRILALSRKKWLNTN